MGIKLIIYLFKLFRFKIVCLPKISFSKFLIIISYLFLLFTLSIVVTAVPSGPSSATNLGSSRYSSAPAANISAVAGNVTELNFIANTVTDTWQGYYGNVTGQIVLGNINNQSMYNWNLTSPSGQIYATRNATVPTWANIRCANFSEVNAEDAALNVNQSVEQDSVNRTFFNTTSFNQFYVGARNINITQNCYAVQLYNSSGVSSASFSEVLLSDNAGSKMIYTGLITTPTLGFDNRSHQFEMIVGENGKYGDTTTTPYYFYLELY
jgi:hypothetical protein